MSHVDGGTPKALIEPSRNSAASCKKCQGKIMEGEMRMTVFVASFHHDGHDAIHYHAMCRGAPAAGFDPRSLLNLPWREQLKYSEEEAHKSFLRGNSSAQVQSDEYCETLRLLRLCRPTDVKALVEENSYAIKDGTRPVSGGTLNHIAADGLAFGALAKCPVCASRALRCAGHGQAEYCITWCEGYLGTTRCEFLAKGWDNKREEAWTVSAILRKGAAKKAMRSLAELVDARCGRDGPEEAPKKKRKKKGEEEEVKAEVKVEEAVFVPLRSVSAESSLLIVDDIALQEAAANVGQRNASVHLSHSGCTAWNATLVLVDAKAATNKFYKMQLLNLSASSYAVFSRWGRVGEDDQGGRRYYGHENSKQNKCMLHPHSSLGGAQAEFAKLFTRHTDNDWNLYASSRAFAHKPGCYDLVRHADAELPSEEQEAVEPAPSPLKKAKAETEEEDCHLDPAVRSFVDLIFSKRMIQEELKARQVDTDKFPLGELSKATISAAYGALSRASRVLEEQFEEEDVVKKMRRETEISAATNDFLRAVPHIVSKTDQASLRLGSKEVIQQKLELVAALEQILERMHLEGGAKKEEEESSESMSRRQYASLRCGLENVQRDSTEFREIEAYLLRGGLPRGTRLDRLLRATREDEAARFAPYAASNDRQQLWHGSGLCNWPGILSQGLRIAPPEAPASGYNFDKGLYFADAACKSAAYCRAPSSSTAVLLLAEVALGDPLVKTFPDIDANNARRIMAKDSVFARGMRAPDPQAGVHLDSNGSKTPLGDLVDRHVGPSGETLGLGFNEYIVYEPSRVKFRYILQTTLGTA